LSIQTHTLSNGFRIVTEAMPGLKSASIGIWVQAGGRHERLEQNGIAHFLEHMAFKGTQTRTAFQIAETIEDVGGYINAYTSREMTAYYARVLGEDVGLALDVIADILTGSTLETREIDIERGVILQEIGQAHDTPDDIIFDWLQEVSFPGQAMGRPILGPAERVAAFTRDDLVQFVDAYYGPEHLILSAAGDVDHGAIVAEAERQFGHLPRRDEKRPEPATFSGGERREIKNLEQAHFALSLANPGYRDPDLYVAQIYASIIGGGMSSRLFQEIRERRGLCYTIFAQAAPYADAGSLMIYAGTGAETLTELASVVADELRRVPESLSEAEVRRARTQMKAGLLMGLESPSGRCERLARMLAIWDRVPSLEETVERIDAVGHGDVANFARRLCEGADPALALYGPVGDAPDVSALKARLAA